MLTSKKGDSKNAGRWIGWVERFLIFTFVLGNQYDAIGLIIAAKSILRFPDRQENSEYILLGTLLSATLAVAVGLVVTWVAP